MPRFKVYIEYEGTRYSGWQIQKNARTVQGEIMAAMASVFQTRKFEFYGSGRTDAGVHALMQVAHLDVDTMLGPEIIRMKVNDGLPADINILEIEKASPQFHARHDTISRSYVYQIARRRTAFGKRFVWWIKDPLQVEKMRKAAALFVGMKNLASFTEDDPDEKSTKVLIDKIEIGEEGALLLIFVEGSHFLWKLVRRIVGVLTEVGRGNIGIEDVERYINTPSDEPARTTAPPSGLFLHSVIYQGDGHPLFSSPVQVPAWTHARRHTPPTHRRKPIPKKE